MEIKEFKEIKDLNLSFSDVKLICSSLLTEIESNQKYINNCENGKVSFTPSVYSRCVEELPVLNRLFNDFISYGNYLQALERRCKNVNSN